MVPDKRAEELVPNQNPSIGARVSVEKKAALRLFREDQNKKRTAAEGAIDESEIVRDALDLYFRENWGRLPEEARDLLDDDPVANAGGDEEVEA